MTMMIQGDAPTASSVPSNGMPSGADDACGPIHEKDSANGSMPRRSRWRAAGRHVVMGLGVTNNFQTLRDMCGVNEIDISELTTVKKLGQGAFGVVEQCMYLPQAGGQAQLVAVKKFKPDVVAKPEDMAAFMSEVAVLRKLQHRHIMDYVGIGSVDRSSEALRQSSMFLVVELMEGGTLKRLVMKQMTAPHSCLYSHHDALRWCSQVASALQYMHAASPMVIHRDLKLDNILLKGKDTCCQEAKLADFGLVAFINKKQQHSMRVPNLLDMDVLGGSARTPQTVEQLQRLWSSRTVGMMTQSSSLKTHVSDPAAAAPGSPGQGLKGLVRKVSRSMRLDHHEDSAMLYLAGLNDSRSSLNVSKLQLTGRTGTLMYMAPEMFKNEKYNEKVDVFSFGMVMYELLHKYMMVFAVSIQGTEQEIEQYAERVASGWRPPINNLFPPEVQSLITDTWAQDANSRPSMSEVAQRLAYILNNDVMDLMPADMAGCTCAIS